MKAILFSGLLGLVLLTGCEQKSETPTRVSEINDGTESATKEAASSAKTEAAPAADDNTVAIIKTSEGDMVIEFWPDVAPKTVANFKKLAKEDFYDGTAFHRIVSGFMIQGGDFLSKDLTKESEYGTGNPGFTVPAEFSDRKHERGVISMARLGHDVNSASSQFFICHATVPFLDGQYTAFGKLIKGDDVLEKIAKTPVKMYCGEASKPTRRIEILDVELVPRDKVE